MRPTQLGRVNVISMVALLLVAVLAPAVHAEDSYSRLVGTWSGPVVWPNGSASFTLWRINPDGTFSIQTDEYTAVGALKPIDTGYAFTYERGGEDYTGTLAGHESNGQYRLIGSGESPNGPINITLSQAS